MRTIALLDYGMKDAMAVELVDRGCDVVIFPQHSSWETIKEIDPSGIVLSNGPGDPAGYVGEIEVVKNIIASHIPTFGICLGHQLVALASGARTYKMTFGHRGLNHPVIDHQTEKAFFTSQNHGYAVDQASISNEWSIRFSNLLDGTVEGLIHKKLPILTTQFHPEASPGPHDSRFLFDTFVALL